MTDRPIIYSAPMVQALFADRKTMTRRMLYRLRKTSNATYLVNPINRRAYEPPMAVRPDGDKVWTLSGWEKAKAGDRLWVRETFAEVGPGDVGYGITVSEPIARYRANDKRPGKTIMIGGWTPAIHMPRKYSRLTLIVTGTKIERLHKISRADVLAEGVPVEHIDRCCEFFHPNDAPGIAFGQLWDSIHGGGSWNENPWVVAISFTVHEKNIDDMEKAS